MLFMIKTTLRLHAHTDFFFDLAGSGNVARKLKVLAAPQSHIINQMNFQTLNQTASNINTYKTAEGRLI